MKRLARLEACLLALAVLGAAAAHGGCEWILPYDTDRVSSRSDLGPTDGSRPERSGAEGGPTDRGAEPRPPDRGRHDQGDVCQAKYGSAPGYILCWQDAQSCAFNAETRRGSCGSLCSQLGGVCLGAKDNPNNTGEECIPLLDHTCDESSTITEICVCSK